MDNSAFPNETTWDNRCHVIKLLQEQIQQLLFYKNNYEQMEKRAELAEKQLDVREQEIKYKFDEQEEIFEEMEKENRQLKEQLAITSRQTIIQTVEDEGMVNKYLKWKRKFRALANANPEAAHEYEFETLEQKYDTNARELEDLKNASQDLQDKNKNLATQFESTSVQNHKLLAQNAELLKKNKALSEENVRITEQNQKLQDSTKQKSTLLNHSRVQQEKQAKTRQQQEQTVLTKAEEQKKKNSILQTEIIRLTNAFDQENKKRQNSEKNFRKFKKNTEATKEKLLSTIKKLKSENQSLQMSISKSNEGSQLLENQNESLRNEKQELELALKRAAKVQKHKERLEIAMNEMQETIDQLQCSLSSVESDASTKTDELSNLVIKHFGGDAMGLGWDDILKFIEGKFDALKQTEEATEQLKTTLAKLKKRNTKMSKEIQQMSDFQTKLDSQTASEGFSDSRSDLPPIIVKEIANPFDSINDQRHALSRRILKHYFALVDEINKALNQIENVEQDGVSMRGVVLASIFAIRWMHFKKTDQIDKNGILEYSVAVPRKQTSRLNQLVQKWSELQNDLKHQTTQNSLLMKSNQTNQQKTLQAEKELRIRQKEIEEQTEQMIQIQEDYEEIKSRIQEMVEPESYKALQTKLNAQIQQNKQVEEQLIMMKSEMKKLLDSIDGDQYEAADLHNQITIIAGENEELRQAYDDLSHELSVCQAALKDRTRELLALERRYQKQKQNVVIVKNSLPSTPQPSRSKTNDDCIDNMNFMNESIRGGLAQMQNKILQGDIVV